MVPPTSESCFNWNSQSGSGRLYKNILWRFYGKDTSRLNISIHLVLVIMVVLVFPAVAVERNYAIISRSKSAGRRRRWLAKGNPNGHDYILWRKAGWARQRHTGKLRQCTTGTPLLHAHARHPLLIVASCQDSTPLRGVARSMRQNV